METKELGQRLEFLREIDRLKSVVRQSPLLDRSRKENSAEHSWHLAIYAWLLADTAGSPIQIDRVIRMLLLHDIVEIDAGDFPIHASKPGLKQSEAEEHGAQRVFGLLPSAQREEFLMLWREFEAAKSEDAKFAKAMDRFQPLLVNLFTGGGTWSENGVSREQVVERVGTVIDRGAPELWAIAEPWVNAHFDLKQ